MLGNNKFGFTNTVSGNLNKRQDAKYKQIDLNDLDVEMVSPQFLQFKTLKRPLREQDVSLAKTNPNGVRAPAHRDDEEPSKEYPTSVIFKKDEPRQEKRKEHAVSVIDMSGLNIKPAYKTNNYFEVPQAEYTKTNAVRDGNTILSAMMRKGLKPEVAIKPEVLLPKEEKKVGPAEAKLKALMKKNQPQPQIIKQTKSTIITKPNRKEQKKSEPSQIGQQIPEDFDDEYGNEQFEKVSGAYESAIKQSIAGDSGIRESIAGESMIKESIAGESMIKQSIRESIRESLIGGSSSRIRQSIREDIRESLNQSGRSMKEEIIEEISASFKKSKESIEEVYEEIFEEESLSNSLSKSQNKFKRSTVKQTDSLSQSASKSFRMKTNIAKSLRFAEQIKGKDKEIVLIDDKKMNESINKEKSNLNRIKENVAKLMNQKKESKNTSEKNKDLYYNFKVQINKLITSDNFESKLKKLSSFLSISSDIAPNKEYVNQLEQGILRNVMVQVENMKVGKSNLDEMQRMRKEYDEKLKEQLKIQEINLRAEMNQKISEKDLQLKKMIAELESRMMSRTVQRGSYGEGLPSYRAEKYEVESDYSIDSDNISWKADLWELLPQFEKKKLYEKQTAEVTRFLADVMVNELKEEALERSLDISFQFPEEYNNIEVSYESKASSNPQKKSQNIENQSWQKPNFSKKEPEVKHDRSEYLADLPKLNIKKPPSNESLNISSSSREQIEIKFEKIRRDEKLKPEIIRILSDYKNLYLKKKQQTVRKILKVLSSKDSNSQKFLYSTLQEITILSNKQYKQAHQLYIRAYEEEILWNLVGIYNRSLNKKIASVEKEMNSMYDRLIVVSQIATADKCTQRISLDVEKDAEYNVEALTRDALKQMEFAPCAIEIVANENYMELKSKREQKLIQGELVEHIVSILSAEFAKEFPKRKK